MSLTSVGTIAKQSVGWSIALSVLMLVAGICAIVIPPAAGMAVILVVAWLLMFSGAAHIVFDEDMQCLFNRGVVANRNYGRCERIFNLVHGDCSLVLKHGFR